MINEHIHKILTYSMKPGKSTWYGKNKKKLTKNKESLSCLVGLVFIITKLKDHLNILLILCIQ